MPLTQTGSQILHKLIKKHGGQAGKKIFYGHCQKNPLFKALVHESDDGRNAAEKIVDAILLGEDSGKVVSAIHDEIRRRIRNVIQKRKEIKQLQNKAVRECIHEALFDSLSNTTTVEDFHNETNHPLLCEEINSDLNAGSTKYYNAVPGLHRALIQTGFSLLRHNPDLEPKSMEDSEPAKLIHYAHSGLNSHLFGVNAVTSWAGYKLRLPNGAILSGRHEKDLEKHLHHIQHVEAGDDDEAVDWDAEDR